MTVTINGTTGVAGVDGTASTPAIQGNDTNTGIFFPAADTIAFAEGGVESMRIDSTGDVNLYSGKSFKSYNPANTRFGSFLTSVDGTVVSSFNGSGEPLLLTAPTGYMNFSTNGSERMRIDSSGRLLVGQTSYSTTTNGVALQADGSVFARSGTSASTNINLANGNGVVGSITTSGSSTAYNTSSDYRLKENIAPMTGALAKVSALKPVTYTWKADGSDGQGFIAHELAEVAPDCVTGEKDAVDEEGNPQYQGIDTSFLTATLTAAIQELNAKVDSLQAELATLKGQA